MEVDSAIRYGGVFLKGPTADGSSGQSLITNGSGQTSFASRLPQIITDTDFYVDATSGSDSNDGSSGSKWQTIQHALDVLGGYHLGGNTMTVNLTAETHAGAVLAAPILGGTVLIKGSTSSPGSYVISSRIEAQNQASLQVSGLDFTPGGGDVGLYANSGGRIKMVGACIFGVCTNIAVYATGAGSGINLAANYTIDGNEANHMAAEFGAGITCNDGLGITVTLTGTPAWSSRFCYVSDCGNLRLDGITYSGSATGKRYDAYSNGAIETFGGGASYLPGNSAGATDGFGVYN